MIRLFVIALASLASFFLCFVVLATFVFPSQGSKGLAALIAAALGWIAMPAFLRRIWRASPAPSKCGDGGGLYPECLWVVMLDGKDIVVTRPDGRATRLPLAGLEEIAVVTNDSGPWEPAGCMVAAERGGRGEPLHVSARRHGRIRVAQIRARTSGFRQADLHPRDGLNLKRALRVLARNGSLRTRRPGLLTSTSRDARGPSGRAALRRGSCRWRSALRCRLPA